MNILIALDSFKGSLSSLQAGMAVKEGIRKIFPDAEITIKPLADGGEGTLEALTAALDGSIHTTLVTGPQSRPVLARYGLFKESAVIEMAQSSGLIQITDGRLNPHLATSAGFGELIKKALDSKVKEIILCLGGSASTEAGIGMLSMLGARFLDASGKELPALFDSLEKIESIDVSRLDPRLKKTRIIAACDVDNPLCGPNGAIAVYGPQKGVKEEEIKEMDEAMAHYAHIVSKSLGKECSLMPGAGAAGGMGFALFSYFPQVEFVSGSKLVLERLHFKEALQKADILITGEGRIDGQSILGKGPVALCHLAKKINPDIITLALAGSLAHQAEAVLEEGVDDYFCILQSVQSLSKAMEPEQAKENLKESAAEIFRLIALLEKNHG